MAAPERPDAPEIGTISHHSIELTWKDPPGYSGKAKTDGRLRFCLQEADKSQGWGNVYTGYAHHHIIDGLEPYTPYKYRLRAGNDIGNSGFSSAVEVTTAKAPLTGEQLHKTINITQDVRKVEEILGSGDVFIDVQDKFGMTPLMVCAQRGYKDIMDMLIKRGTDINLQSGSGKDALMLAAFAGQLEAVRELRSHGATYDQRDKGGSTALHWAVDGGHLKVVQWMIKDGASVDEVDWGSKWTPLMRCAAMSGHIEIARELLFAGADVNKVDKDGKTPLMLAALNGYEVIVQMLVDRGADPFRKTEFGKVALDMAKSFDRKKVVKYLEGVTEKLRKSKRGVAN